MPAHRTPKGVPLIHTTLRSINIELLTEFLWTNLQTQSPLLHPNQVIVIRTQIVIDRSDRFDFDLTLRDDFVEQQIESIRVARLDKQSPAIVMQARLDHVVVAKHARGQERRLVAANQNLHRMLD